MKRITLNNFLYHPDIKTNSFKSYIPVGIISLMTALSNKGIKFKFIDFQTDLTDLCKENVINKLSDDSDLLCVSSLSMMFPWLFQSLEILKYNFPTKKIIIGGPGPSAVSNEIMNNYSFIDYIIRGEGETALPILVEEISKKSFQLEKINNLSFRDNRTIIKNKKIREKINHKLKYSLIDLSKYYYNTSILTTRGCLYDCSFCYNKKMWGEQIQLKDINEIFNDIDNILENTNLNHIQILDDMFFVSKKRINDFVNMYLNGEYNFKYLIMGARLDLIDEETMIKLRKTNCVSIWFGVESGSDIILNKIQKRINLTEIRKKYKLIQKYIPSSIASFIVGFPYETLDDFKRTIELANDLDLKGTEIVIGFLRPQNGTQLYREYAEKLFFIDHPYIIKPTKLTDEIKRIILSNKSIFSWYYTYETNDLEKKLYLFSQLNFKSQEEKKFRLLQNL